jgi:2-methylisocitrate lyase-like PEP mutase family enzyme
MTNPRAQFRELIARKGCISQPVVYDAFGARIAEDLGFEAIALGGYAMGAALATSEPLLSLEDVATITRYITLATNLPLMVDAGAGWGEPLHTMHTVRVLEHAGATSVHIEDQIFPKRVHYHKGVEHVIPVDEMTTKLRWAQQGRRDPNFVIVARTDAMRTDGYDEGIRRARAYMDAGADMIMMFPNNEEETKQAPKDLPGVPLIYVNSEGNRLNRGVFSVQQLDEWGWKVASDAITTINVVGKALRDVLSNLKVTGSTGLKQDEMIPIRKFVEDTIKLDRYYQIEEETVEHD